MTRYGRIETVDPIPTFVHQAGRSVYETQTKIDQWCEAVIEAGWLAALVLSPLFFNVFSSRVFEPDKISLLRIARADHVDGLAAKTCQRRSGLVARLSNQWQRMRPTSSPDALDPFLAYPLPRPHPAADLWPTASARSSAWPDS